MWKLTTRRSNYGKEKYLEKSSITISVLFRPIKIHCTIRAHPGTQKMEKEVLKIKCILPDE